MDERRRALRIHIHILIVVTAVAVGLTAAAGFSMTEVWGASGKTKAASMDLIRKDGRAFDFRTEAGQKLYGYDTLQGACADSGYAYLTLYDRTVEWCRIVKVDLKKLCVVKVSAPLPIYHGNNLTFNTKKGLLLATCCRVKGKRAVFIHPGSLTVAGVKDIRLTKKVKKLPASERRKYKGFTAIAYNASRDCYVGRLRSSGNVILFDGNLRPKKYIRLSGKKTKLLNQGMDSVGNRIYDVRSFKGKRRYNMVTIHTLSGKLVGRMKIPYGKAPGSELQCVFHDGGQFYAGIYLTTSQVNDTKANHVNRINLLYRLNNL